MKTILSLALAALMTASATVPAAIENNSTRTATGHLCGYDGNDCLIATDDGNLWAVRDDLPMTGDVTVTFATNGTADVLDDEIIAVEMK